MALKATVFKATLNIADMDRHYYEEHSLTIARHPSENDLRMMTRLAVFALNAEPQLNFTKGLSTDDEPDLWVKDYSNHIVHWIELGQPDEKRIRQASGRSDRVSIYCYSGQAAEIWWEQNRSTLQRFAELRVFNFDHEALQQLTDMAQRNMQLHCTIQDGELMVSDGEHSVTVTWQQWFPA
ncbi:YaeQ family protein [Pseudomaricurvus alkylphenolicus]|uniref:YaeQ family protein n=1 Tax=Pseudomaricurvus alkylphenolicus TaxID=1306991 RepID=UPI00141E8A87|nr:YaeQ family protein [Pseudomaricurvus alkylphenolicus]NIB43990.1 YaeQ family protein [Pseudomaricurvus alkylphenolicus]